jgi:TPP-dependent 2-oxoacid decarboxylase
MRLLGPQAIPVLSSFVVSFALPLSLFLVAAFWHGSIANAMSQAIGAQAALPRWQVISLSGDGGSTC